jgi:cytochrome c-type biogenesis protein
MAIELGYLRAVGAGALSFLSPCVLPLVPPYLCYMAGVSVDDFRADAVATAKSGARTALLASSLSFVLGFSTVFVALGAGASTIGRLLRIWQEPLAMAAGILIILMGLNFLGVIRIPMGLAFAFGWTPCIGPVLGPILTLAGGRETVGEGALLLAAYSFGLGIPFLVAALFSGAFMRFLQKFRVHLGRVEKAIGALLVVAGILFLTGGIQTASYWLLETFPGLGRLG